MAVYRVERTRDYTVMSNYGGAAVYLIQPAPIVAPVIADLQRLGLGDSPFHQWIAVMRIVFALCPRGRVNHRITQNFNRK